MDSGGGGGLEALAASMRSYWRARQPRLPEELQGVLRGLLEHPQGLDKQQKGGLVMMSLGSLGLSLGAQPTAAAMAGSVGKPADLPSAASTTAAVSAVDKASALVSQPGGAPSGGPLERQQQRRRFPRRAAVAAAGESEEEEKAAAPMAIAIGGVSGGDGGSSGGGDGAKGEKRARKKRVTYNVRRVDVMEEDAPSPGVVCVEVTKGRRRVYRGRGGDEQGWEGFDMTDERVSNGNIARDFFAGYLLPQGFPDSVAPQYAHYMGWRGCQYFFGGAMSVFTTRSLLGALGVGGRHKGEAAAAINWVMKDGAGRLGRFLFARWGRALDCELKQFRLAGDLLMEGAAALELATAAAPRAFLPLACTANLAKNLAAVAASSTRAPIYRTFARQNNLADVTAKGESVANLADIVGTVFGICLSRAPLPLVPTFCALSCGYLYASRREVDSVELPYLNRARLSYTARRFMEMGQVPSTAEANAEEPLMPWGSSQRVVLGARVEEAVGGPTQLAECLETWKGRPYALTIRPDTGKVYVMLHEGVRPSDILEGAFHAHYLLHRMDLRAAGEGGGNTGAVSDSDAAAASANPGSASGAAAAAVVVAPPPKHKSDRWGMGGHDGRGGKRGQAPVPEELLPHLLQDAVECAPGRFAEFSRQAAEAGWKLQLTMLNPQETRLRSSQPLLAVKPLPAGAY